VSFPAVPPANVQRSSKPWNRSPVLLLRFYSAVPTSVAGACGVRRAVPGAVVHCGACEERLMCTGYGYGPQPPDCRKDVRKLMYEFSPEAADVRMGGGGLFRSEVARRVLTLRAGWGAAGCPAIGAGRPD
jgi:hypothetical protein